MPITEQYTFTCDANYLYKALEHAKSWLEIMYNTFGNLHVDRHRIICEGDYWLVEIVLSTNPVLKEKTEPIYFSETQHAK